jgi:hypothetical protein
MHFLILSVGSQPRPSFDFLSQRLYPHAPMKKRADDEDSHVRTSSMSSTSAPAIPPPPPPPPPQINQKLTVTNEPCASVKVDIFFVNNRFFTFFCFSFEILGRSITIIEPNDSK